VATPKGARPNLKKTYKKRNKFAVSLKKSVTLTL
jgi:hypothetical protein